MSFKFWNFSTSHTLNNLVPNSSTSPLTEVLCFRNFVFYSKPNIVRVDFCYPLLPSASPMQILTSRIKLLVSSSASAILFADHYPRSTWHEQQYFRLSCRVRAKSLFLNTSVEPLTIAIMIQATQYISFFLTLLTTLALFRAALLWQQVMSCEKLPTFFNTLHVTQILRDISN
jgi:hypothetical protein